MKVPGEAEMKLVDEAVLELHPENGRAIDQRNDLMLIEVPLPDRHRGKVADFRFRVDADGSSGQDWVTWTELSLTTA